MPVLTMQSASGAQSVSPALVSANITIVPMPSRSHAWHVSTVSVCELPVWNVVQDHAVGADPMREAGRQHRRPLLLERRRQVSEREDHPGEVGAVLPVGLMSSWSSALRW